MGKAKTYVTGKGTIVGFCALNKPWEDEYVCTVAFEGDELKKTQKVIKQVFADDPRKDTPADPWKEKDGHTFLRFKKPGGFTKKDGEDGAGERVDLFVDFIGPDRKPFALGTAPIICEGSTVRVKFGVRQTEFGGKQFVKLNPFKIQLINVVSNLTDSDFDEEEGTVGVDQTVNPGVEEDFPDAPADEEVGEDTDPTKF